MFADALEVLYNTFLSSLKFKASIKKRKILTLLYLTWRRFSCIMSLCVIFIECFHSLCLNVQYKAKHLKTKVLYIFDQKFTLESRE